MSDVGYILLLQRERCTVPWGRGVAKPSPYTDAVRRTDSVGLTGPWPPSPASRSSQVVPA